MYITPEQQEKLRELILNQGWVVMEAYKNRRSLITEYKADGCDFVTETDRLVEKNLIEGILTLFPDAIIHGEEYGLTEDISGDRPIFVIDPIDGTKYFRYGMSLFTISIGIQFAGKPIYGIILNPLSGDIIFGWTDYGVFDQFWKVEIPGVKPLHQTQIYFDTVGIHEVSEEDRVKWLELIKRLNIEVYRSRSAWASCMFAFGAVNGLIGGMIDIFWGVKVTDQIGFFAILEWLWWEVREVTYGNIRTSWLAPSSTLDDLLLLLA